MVDQIIQGAVVGETETWTAWSTNMAVSMFVVGDIRDAVLSASDLYTGDGSRLANIATLGISGVGILTTAQPELDPFATVARSAFRRLAKAGVSDTAVLSVLRGMASRIYRRKGVLEQHDVAFAVWLGSEANARLFKQIEHVVTHGDAYIAVTRVAANVGEAPAVQFFATMGARYGDDVAEAVMKTIGRRETDLARITEQGLEGMALWLKHKKVPAERYLENVFQVTPDPAAAQRFFEYLRAAEGVAGLPDAIRQSNGLVGVQGLYHVRDVIRVHGAENIVRLERRLGGSNSPIDIEFAVEAATRTGQLLELKNFTDCNGGNASRTLRRMATRMKELEAAGQIGDYRIRFRGRRDLPGCAELAAALVKTANDVLRLESPRFLSDAIEFMGKGKFDP